MKALHSIELSEVMHHLPQIAPFDDSVSGDLYICALGFEERCLAIPRACHAAECAFSHALYITLNTNAADNRQNEQRLREELSSLGHVLDPLNADDTAFEVALRHLLTTLAAPLDDTLRVVFDVSVAANRLLLRCFKTLLEADVSLTLVYAEASSYHPTQQEYRDNPDKWKSDEFLGTERGVGQIVPSPTFPGQHIDPLPHCVVLFPSFRMERSYAVLSMVDETLSTSRQQNVIWVLGEPHAPEDLWRVEAMEEINRISDKYERCVVSTFDYRSTLTLLDNIYDAKWERYRITVSPLGSKLQGVGVALACYLHPEIQVMFASPKEYNAAEWSSGTKALWQIDFGLTSDVRDILESVGTLSITA